MRDKILEKSQRDKIDVQSEWDIIDIKLQNETNEGPAICMGKYLILLIHKDFS